VRLLSEVRERLRALVFRSREDRELDEELDFHVEAIIEENLRRGMGVEEARRQAALTIGGVQRVKEEVRDARGTRPLEDLVRDFRFALRRLVRERAFSIPTVATTALGIGVTTAVFAMVNAILLRPLPYADADRLVEVRHVAKQGELAVTGLSPGTFLHYRAGNRSFEGIAVYRDHAETLTDADAPEQVRVAQVSAGLFSVLRTTPHRGRFPNPVDVDPGSPGGVIISHRLWVRRYGADPEIVGRTIELDRRPAMVVGVAQPGFHFPHPDTHVWTTSQMEGLFRRFGNQMGGYYLSAVARLERGVSVEAAGRDLDRLVRTLPDAFPGVTAKELEAMGFRAVVAPLKEAIVGNVRAALLVLSATAGFLLLITWANATSLGMLRAEAKRKEVALERALGATDGRLARRFLCESVLLAILGGTMGFILARLAIGLRFGFAPEQIPRLGEVGVDWFVAGFALALSLVTAILLATVSLLLARRPGVAGALVGALGRVTAGRREQVGRQLLVAGQIALALTLLIGSALMAQSYWKLARVELGFDPEGALTFHLPLPSGAYRDPQATALFHHEMLGRLRALPGVKAAEAATTSVFPLTPVPEYTITRVVVPDRSRSDSTTAPQALFGYATPGYFRAMGIRVVQGSTFEGIGNRELPDVILSAAMARTLFDDEDPIGRRVQFYPGGSYRVVGVVGDVPSRSIREGPSSVVYIPNLFPGVPRVALHDEQYVVRTSLPPTSLVRAVRQTIDDVDPKLVMTRIGTLDDLVAGSLARARLTMLLLLVGAATALFLGVIGIYGVLSYAVRQRTSELGVRIALGASPGAVVGMVVRQGALLAVGGIAAGLVAAFALTRFVRSLLYEVSPSDPAAFAGMAALLFAVALAASYVPARRAGRIDPVRALKAE
jgi:putative ABC transport system permease protein